MKTKIRTVNVLVLEKLGFDEVSIEKITSFVDTKEGYKAANALFKKTVNSYYKKENGSKLHSSELESILLEGSYVGTGYDVFLNYSS